MGSSVTVTGGVHGVDTVYEPGWDSRCEVPNEGGIVSDLQDQGVVSKFSSIGGNFFCETVG